MIPPPPVAGVGYAPNASGVAPQPIGPPPKVTHVNAEIIPPKGNGQLLMLALAAGLGWFLCLMWSKRRKHA